MFRRIYGKTVRSLTRCGASFGIAALRISLGIIFLWFALPKFFPGASPAEALATDTTQRLTFGLIEGTTASVLTGVLETAIGLLLMSGKALAPTVIMLLGHMAGACTPLVIFPDRTWKHFAVATLEGQYILKNLVFVAAAFVILGHSRTRGNRTPPDSPLPGKTPAPTPTPTTATPTAAAGAAPVTDSRPTAPVRPPAGVFARPAGGTAGDPPRRTRT
ncbi:hypothetical protein [Streptomyces sp. NBC_01506]|uniref:hypothetical protein n=1 Tax=Streptomyces sp. NBC_01506 TaxID=2903887 RepID=UPI00386A84B7